MNERQVRGFRLRVSTWYQWQDCVALARAIRCRRDSDWLLSRALFGLEQRLRDECAAEGIDPALVWASDEPIEVPDDDPPPREPNNLTGL